MDENSCENETSESADGQKEKETENATELEKVWVNIHSKGKRKLNQISDHSRYSYDSSGPSTDFSPPTENDNGGKIMPPLLSIQAVKSTASVEEKETGTEKTIKAPELKEQELQEQELQEQELQEPELLEPELKEPEFKEPELKEPEFKEPELNEPELKEQELEEPELKEPLASTEENAKVPQEPSVSMEENVQSSTEEAGNANASVAASSGPPGYEEPQEIQTRVRLAPGVEEEIATRRPSVGPPPSYSFVMKQKKKIKPVPSIDPFVTNTSPPPTYSGTRGIFFSPEERVCNFPSFAEPIWRSHSQPALCPRCGIIVLTTTHTHDSKATHVAALALCLLGCWPCCLLPYCMNVCKNTYHHCPICQTFLGLYRPW